MNWQLWGRGILAGAISGVLGGVAITRIDPHAGWKEIASMVFGFALTGALNYLKTHPVPEDVNGGK